MGMFSLNTLREKTKENIQKETNVNAYRPHTYAQIIHHVRSVNKKHRLICMLTLILFLLNV